MELHHIQIADSEDFVIVAKEEEDILSAAIRQRIAIPYACRGGGCGLCKIQVISGLFEQGKCSKIVLPDHDREANYSLACKTFSRSDMNIRVQGKIGS